MLIARSTSTNAASAGTSCLISSCLHCARYGGKLQSNQEDWGWFVWFEQPGAKLPVDVHIDDHGLLEFQLLLASRRPRFLLGAKTQDTPVLEQLRGHVVSRLQVWPVEQLSVDQ